MRSAYGKTSWLLLTAFRLYSMDQCNHCVSPTIVVGQPKLPTYCPQSFSLENTPRKLFIHSTDSGSRFAVAYLISNRIYLVEEVSPSVHEAVHCSTPSPGHCE